MSDDLPKDLRPYNAQKMKFSIKDLFSKYDQIRRFQWIWSHLLKKFFKKNFIFYALLGDKKYYKNLKIMCRQGPVPNLPSRNKTLVIAAKN